MSAGRAHPDATYLALKAETRRLIKACGGVESAASVTRVDFQTLSRYSRPQEQQFIPVDVIADLEQDCGEPVVTRALADLAGYDLVKRESAAEPGEAERAFQALVSAEGEVTCEGIRALLDGAIDPGEAAAMLPKAKADLLATLNLVQALQRRASSNVAPIRRAAW